MHRCIAKALNMDSLLLEFSGGDINLNSGRKPRNMNLRKAKLRMRSKISENKKEIFLLNNVDNHEKI